MKPVYTCSCGRVTDNVYWHHPKRFHVKLTEPICWDCYERGSSEIMRARQERPADAGGAKFRHPGIISQIQFHGPDGGKCDR